MLNGSLLLITNEVDVTIELVKTPSVPNCPVAIEVKTVVNTNLDGILYAFDSKITCA